MKYIFILKVSTLSKKEYLQMKEKKNEDSSINPYDLGALNNLKQVLGPNIFLWFFPTKVTTNGLYFEGFNIYLSVIIDLRF